MAKKTGKHTADQIESFWKLLADGWAYSQIEKKIGVSMWTCMDWRQFKTQVSVNMRMAEKYGFVKGAA